MQTAKHCVHPCGSAGACTALRGAAAGPNKCSDQIGKCDGVHAGVVHELQHPPAAQGRQLAGAMAQRLLKSMHARSSVW